MGDAQTGSNASGSADCSDQRAWSHAFPGFRMVLDLWRYADISLLIGRSKSALASKRVSLCSRLPDTRYLVWIDRNLISTLQDRHGTHAATLRVGKHRKGFIAGRLQRMVERRGLEPFTAAAKA